MRQSKESLYNKDFYKWAQTQACLLKKGEFQKIDIQHVIEEMESLGKTERRSLRSYLIVLMQHMLKNTYASEQKGNSRSWDATILNSRRGIQSLLKDSPSLKNEVKDLIQETYQEARELALIETNLTHTDAERFPLECPWTIKKLVEG